MALFATVSVALVFLLVARGRSRRYRYAGGVALAGHVFVAIAVLPHVSYNWDIGVFHEAALHVLGGGTTAPFSAVDAFAAAQALVYAVFGADPTALAIVNGLLGVLTPLPVGYLARRLYPAVESTPAVSLVVLFLPLPFLFSSLPMRDALSTLLAMTLLALAVRALVDRDYPWGVAAFPAWGLLFLLREELALLAFLGVAGAVGVRAVRTVTDRDVSVASLLPVALPVGLVGFGLFALLFPVSGLNARLQYRSTGGAAYLEFMEYDSWLDVALAAPVRAIYFQFAPFPLHVDSGFDLAAALSLPIVIALAVVASLSLRRVETDPTVEFLLVTVYVGGVVGYGLIDANFGTTVRHRSPFVFLLAVFGAPVLESWLRSLRRRVGHRDDHRGHDRERRQKAEELEGRP